MIGVFIAIAKLPTLMINQLTERIACRLRKYLTTGIFTYIITQYLLIIRIVVKPEDVVLIDSFISIFLFYGLSLFLIPTILYYFIFMEDVVPID